MYLPMLAECVPVEALDRPDLYFEPKLDGLRCLAQCSGEEVTLYGRGQLGPSYTQKFPEVTRTLAGLGISCVLDGELICFRDLYRESFKLVSGRVHRDYDYEVYAEKTPACFMAFDMLEFDGRDLTELPYIERREYLVSLNAQQGRHFKIVDSFSGAGVGRVMWDFVEAFGAEGVICKDPSSRYQAGKRSKAWGKIKAEKQLDVVALAMGRGTGKRAETFGSLFCFVQECGKYRYVGNCGTGFDDTELIEWETYGLEHEVSSDMYSWRLCGPRVDLKKIKRWIRPRTLSVRFMEWTDGGKMRMIRKEPSD